MLPSLRVALLVALLSGGGAGAGCFLPSGNACCGVDLDCVEGARCFEGRCALLCDDDSQCAEGEACLAATDAGGGGVCRVRDPSAQQLDGCAPPAPAGAAAAEQRRGAP